MMKRMKCKRWLLAATSSLLLLVVWIAGPVGEASAAPLIQDEAPIRHTVQTGETLFRIAQQYDTTVEAIVAANGITDPNRIRVGQQLVIPTSAQGSSVEEGGAPAAEPAVFSTYVVVPGDTLHAVARRFDASVTAVAALNGLVLPSDLPVGERLRIPGQNAGRLHRVAEGETALGLALRYSIPMWELLGANGLSSSSALLPHQLVLVSSEATTDTLPSPFVALDVGPVPVVQGHTVRVKAELAPGAALTGVFDDEVLNLVIEGDAYYALFGVHVLADPGVYALAFLATDAAGDEVYVMKSIEVVDGAYPVEVISLLVDLLDDEALAAERARVAEIKPVFTPERFWDGLFTRPITTEITSDFGVRRLYKYPSTQFYGYHEGTDFDGVVGSPVYAPAAGVVVLAEPLYLRGNALVIDHGWGVHTGYWHLSQIDVEVGQFVSPGDHIAQVGSTGRSTGAHLHWNLWVNGTNVNALQWTEYTFP